MLSSRFHMTSHAWTNLVVIKEAVPIRIYLRKMLLKGLLDQFFVVNDLVIGFCSMPHRASFDRRSGGTCLFLLKSHRVAIAIIAMRVLRKSFVDVRHVLLDEVFVVAVCVPWRNASPPRAAVRL